MAGAFRGLSCLPQIKSEWKLQKKAVNSRTTVPGAPAFLYVQAFPYRVWRIIVRISQWDSFLWREGTWVDLGLTDINNSSSHKSRRQKQIRKKRKKTLTEWTCSGDYNVRARVSQGQNPTNWLPDVDLPWDGAHCSALQQIRWRGESHLACKLGRAWKDGLTHVASYCYHSGLCWRWRQCELFAPLPSLSSAAAAKQLAQGSWP